MAAKWTVASAARFARQARVETVAHLETAPIARQLRQDKLRRAYQIHNTALRNRDAAKVLLYGGLGYRPPYPDTWETGAELLSRDEAHYLAAADLYVITPQLCDVVIAAAQSLTVDDLKLLDEDDLPSRTGLLMLPHPLLVKTVGGGLADDRAFLWHSPATFTVPDETAPDGLDA